MSDPLVFRTLAGPDSLPATFGRDALSEAYAWPPGRTVRANMIATLDGAITGLDGRSGSLGDDADRAVFDTLRAGCDAIVVGAGTARAEDYGPPPDGAILVVVSRSGALPERLLADPTRVALAVPVGAGRTRAELRAAQGGEAVWVFSGDQVSPPALLERLTSAGRRRILLEGGPLLLTQWLAAGCVDELCLTRVPRLIGGGPGLLTDRIGDLAARPLVLLEARGTLFGRWQLAQVD